jgi:hypothetical protein
MPFLKGGSENVPVRIIKAERRSKRFWLGASGWIYQRRNDSV